MNKWKIILLNKTIKDPENELFKVCQYFKNISLVNFRNFDSIVLDFSKNCNVFYGKNGSGKTNILEAISLLTKGRGFKKDKISNIIKNNFNKFIIKSDFQNNEIIYN